MRKPRVLVAWEMGGNFGHVAKFSQILRSLTDRVELHVALREPWQLRQVAPDLDCVCLPAPYAPTRPLPRTSPGVLTYSGIMLTEGWDSADRLGGLVEAWRGLIGLVRADMVVAQSAPTALLAARGLSLPTVVIGGGYDNPPLADPMPLFGLAPPDAAAEQSAQALRQEARVLKVANSVLARLGAPVADRFCDLIRADLSLLVCWPFNDHYGDRSAIEPDHPPYLGPIILDGHGKACDWAEGRPGARIFAYLRPGGQPAAAGLRALAELGPRHNIICAAPGLPETARRALQSRGVQVEAGPIRLAPLLRGCDIGLSHASAGIGAAFLAAGVRQIGLPNHREQAMYARNLGRRGLGVGIEGTYDANAIVTCVETLLSDEAARARLSEIAATIKAQFPDDPAEAAAERLREFLT